MISEAGCTHNEQLLQNLFSLGVVPHIEHCENYTYFHSNAKGNFEVHTYINITFDFINILQKLYIYIYIYIYIYKDILNKNKNQNTHQYGFAEKKLTVNV